MTEKTEAQHQQQRAVLQLDARRREMLELMGVRLWWPEAKAARPQPAAQAEPETPPLHREAPPAVAPRPEPLPRMAAPASRAPAALMPGGEALLADAPQLVYGQAGPGGWLIVADLAPDMFGSYAQALAGDEGRLLANMLRALQLDAGTAPVYLLRVHRGSVQPGEGMPRPLEEVLAPQCTPLAPRVVLALGPHAAQALLQRAGPIGKLRGEALTLPEEGPLAGTPALASYPLAYLLRNGADKAKAWADLCLAASLFER
ncbi:uracil-DNA glycosylase [Variovorax sp. LARHSF232]